MKQEKHKHTPKTTDRESKWLVSKGLHKLYNIATQENQR